MAILDATARAEMADAIRYGLVTALQEDSISPELVKERGQVALVAYNLIANEEAKESMAELNSPDEFAEPDEGLSE